MRSLFLSLLCSASLLASAQDFNSFWAFDLDNSNGVATTIPERIQGDSLENVYVMGFADTTFTANPAGTDTVHISSGSQPYVIKYDSAGNYLWSMVPAGVGVPNDIAAIGASGDVWIAGSLTSATDLDVGPGVATYSPLTIGDADAFLAHYDANGNFITAFQLSGMGPVWVKSLDIAADGNLLVTGTLGNMVDMDPGPGTNTFTRYGSAFDGWIAKFTPAGVLLWARQIGGDFFLPAGPTMSHVAPAADGGAYVIGQYGYSIIFDPFTNPTALIASNGLNWQHYIARYDSTGNLLWFRAMISNTYSFNYNELLDLDVDSANNLYISMAMVDSTNADWNGGNLWFDPADGNGFVAKYNENAQLQWAGQFESTTSANAGGIHVSPEGTVYASGYFQNNVQLDFNGATAPITTGSAEHVFQAVYGTNGDLLWHHVHNPAPHFTANAQWAAPSGNVYSLGTVRGTTDVNPDTATHLLDGVGQWSAWVQKWRPCLPAFITAPTTDVCAGDLFSMSISGYPTINWSNGYTNADSISLTNSTTYTATVSDAYGCMGDTTVSISVAQAPTLALSSSADTVCAGNPVTLTATSSGTVSWSGGIGNASAFTPGNTDTYYATATSSPACPSLIDSISVAVDSVQLSTSTSADSLCEGTQVTLTATGSSTLSWDQGVINGMAFTPDSTQIYTATSSTPFGCSDSATLTVTVISLPQLLISASADSVCAGEDLTLTASGANTITWSQGIANGVAFPLAATQTFVATGSNFGCSATDSISVEAVIVNLLAQSTSDSICPGETVSLTAFGADTYQWENGLPNGSQVSPMQTTLYTVIGTSSIGCTDTASVEIGVHPVPLVVFNAFSPDTYCAIDSMVSMPLAEPPGGTYSGPGVAAGALSLSLAGVGTHNIVYTVQSNAGCVASDTSVVHVDICIGIEPFSSRIDLHLYPNPAREYIMLETANAFSSAAQVELLDLSGKIVQQWRLPANGNREMLRLNNIAAGVYLLQVQNATQLHTAQIVVE